MEANSDFDDVCYQPFAGSGRSLIVGEKTGRGVYAMKLLRNMLRSRYSDGRRFFPETSQIYEAATVPRPAVVVVARLVDGL